jgi:deazaflavin-dependent oxidoreductase (nitroreductase family)
VDYLSLADRSWPVLHRLMGGHAMLYRATGGRVGARIPGLPPMLLLDHRGARSGKLRTTPLVYMPHGRDLLVVASKGGHPRHPAWWHNLQAHPETEIQLGSERMKVRAREASPVERHELWPQAVSYNPHWGRYEQRTERQIPLVVLEPREG